MTDHVNTPSSGDRLTVGPSLETIILGAFLFSASCVTLGSYNRGDFDGLLKEEPKAKVTAYLPKPFPGK